MDDDDDELSKDGMDVPSEPQIHEVHVSKQGKNNTDTNKWSLKFSFFHSNMDFLVKNFTKIKLYFKKKPSEPFKF